MSYGSEELNRFRPKVRDDLFLPEDRSIDLITSDARRSAEQTREVGQMRAQAAKDMWAIPGQAMNSYYRGAQESRTNDDFEQRQRLAEAEEGRRSSNAARESEKWNLEKEGEELGLKGKRAEDQYLSDVGQGGMSNRQALMEAKTKMDLAAPSRTEESHAANMASLKAGTAASYANTGTAAEQLKMARDDRKRADVKVALQGVYGRMAPPGMDPIEARLQGLLSPQDADAQAQQLLSGAGGGGLSPEIARGLASEVRGARAAGLAQADMSKILKPDFQQANAKMMALQDKARAAQDLIAQAQSYKQGSQLPIIGASTGGFYEQDEAKIARHKIASDLQEKFQKPDLAGLVSKSDIRSPQARINSALTTVIDDLKKEYQAAVQTAGGFRNDPSVVQTGQLISTLEQQLTSSGAGKIDLTRGAGGATGGGVFGGAKSPPAPQMQPALAPMGAPAAGQNPPPGVPAPAPMGPIGGPDPFGLEGLGRRK